MTAARAKHTESFETGLELARAGRHVEAIACFEEILADNPNDARALFALGNTAEAIGHLDAAENFFRRVLDEEPDRLEALVNLANVLRARGKTSETIALLKPAIQRNPAQAELWMTLGSGLRETGDRKKAEVFYREALRLAPDYAPALGNLADLIADNGAIDEALSLYDRAIEAEPANAQARLNRSFLHLRQAEFDAGWRDYESRLAIKKRMLFADHSLPRWNGDFTPGLRLLVGAEQGIGDQIMFASLIPELAERIARVRGHLFLEAEPRLVPLFARSFPAVDVRPSFLEEVGGRKLAHYPWLSAAGGADAAIEIGSLPYCFRRSLSDFPQSPRFLKPDAMAYANWANWLDNDGRGPFIGLCWRSGQLGGLRHLQYAPLDAWAKFIASLPGTPVSLQYDATADEIAYLEEQSVRKILVPALDQRREIDAAAAMIAALDVVVSAPTSVAWISAAIGVPTLKILYKDAWTSFGQSYEPFAPQCALVTPAIAGDWSETFALALAELNSRLARP